MNKEVAEWIYIADEDLRTAELLNKVYRPNNETIYYNCAQAIEKYLKGYLNFNNEPFKYKLFTGGILIQTARCANNTYNWYIHIQGKKIDLIEEWNKGDYYK